MNKFWCRLGHFNSQCQDSSQDTIEVSADHNLDPILCTHNTSHQNYLAQNVDTSLCIIPIPSARKVLNQYL